MLLQTVDNSLPVDVSWHSGR